MGSNPTPSATSVSEIGRFDSLSRGGEDGGAVNLAARISALSAPGQLLVSDTVRSLAQTSAEVQFEDKEEQSLKGIAEPVRLFEVIWRQR